MKRIFGLCFIACLSFNASFAQDKLAGNYDQ